MFVYNNPMTDEKDLYYVAIKVLLRDGNNLLIVHDIFGEWEIPGGRILKSEFSVPLEKVLERKIREELGPSVQYKVGKPVTFFRVERIEQTDPPKQIRIFGIGFEAEYLSGEITLGKHHDKFEWVDVTTFQPEKYMTTGWLEGIQEYLEYLRK